jgi:hypothetical protein
MLSTFFTVNLFVVLGSLVRVTECGNILFFGPYVTKSHTITFQPLLKELANRGHEVKITGLALSPKAPNIRFRYQFSPLNSR